MAQILTTAHFSIDPEYKVPNQEEVDLKTFIDNNQAKVLKQLLGIDFYNAFIAGLDADPIVAKWTDLRDGKNYNYTNVTYRFEGIIDLLKPIIFSKWLHFRAQKLTSAGIVVPDPASAGKLESPARLIGKFNSEFFKKVGDVWAQENTLYGFLYANEATYSEWEAEQWCPSGRINILGL